MLVTERTQSERLFHDDQARQRATDLSRRSNALIFSDEAYLDHESWIRPAIERLGRLAGRRVLDFGCGHGMASVVLAHRGARVTAMDLSGGYLAEARQRAAANEATIETVQADAHQLPFPAAAFDGIWGNAVLHHLDLRVAGAELRRVLRPGGVAVFCEPWGENPLLRLARRTLPYRGKSRTRDEEPLRQRDLDCLRESFPQLQMEGFQLLSMFRRLLHVPRLTAILAAYDHRLVRLKIAENWCRYIVLTMRRE